MSNVRSSSAAVPESAVVAITISGERLGTGIVVAQRGERTFVITARHVLRDEAEDSDILDGEAEDILVDGHPAELHRSFVKLDLAVLSVTATNYRPEPMKFCRRIALRENRPDPKLIVAYGAKTSDNQPFEDRSIDGEVTSGGAKGQDFQLSGSHLAPGFSGGPLVQFFPGEALCVGMTLRGNPHKTATAATSVFLHSNEIIDKLRSLGINIAVRSPGGSKRTMKWTVTAMVLLTLGVLAIYLISGMNRRSELDRQACQELANLPAETIRSQIDKYLELEWVRKLAAAIQNDDRLRNAVIEHCSPL
jgi:hypothetical protein